MGWFMPKGLPETWASHPIWTMFMDSVKSSQNSCVCGSAAFTSLSLCFGGVLLTSAQQKSCWGCYLPLKHFQQVPPSITKFSTRTGERLEHCFSSARHVCGTTRTFLISPPGAPVSVRNLSSSPLCMNCWPPSPKAGSVWSPLLLYLAQVLLCLGWKPWGALGSSQVSVAPCSWLSSPLWAGWKSLF